jgi:hypothetical protein
MSGVEHVILGSTMVAINVRLDNTLQAIKDLLERGQNRR